MLRVTVEMVPYGVEKHKRKLGVLNIANTGGGTAINGQYEAEIDGGLRTDSPFCHRRSDGFWELLFLALEELHNSNKGLPKWKKS